MPEAEKKVEAAKSTESIDCKCKKSFFSDNQQIVSVGDVFVWQRKSPDDVFPWPLLQPTDSKLAESLKAEYESARKTKLEAIAEENSRAGLLRRLTTEA